MQLRDNGTYALPNGREFVARTALHGGFFLHDLRLGVASPPLYLIDRSGQFLSWGKVTRWSLEDLRDTGRTSLPELQRVRVL